MKKSAIVAAALLVCSCVMNENNGEHIESTLRVRPAEAMLTRGANDNVFPADKDFALWCLSSPIGSDSKTNFDLLCNAERYSHSTTDNYWHGNEQIVWNETESLTLYGCSPASYSDKCDIDPEKGFILTHLDVLEDEGTVLIAKPLIEIAAKDYSSYVPMTFEHPLCKVDVFIKTSIENVEYKIKKVSIKDLYHCGTYSTEKGWAIEGDKAEIVLFEDPEGVVLPRLGYNLIGSAKMNIPQSFKDAYIEISYEETDYSWIQVTRTYTNEQTSRMSKTWDKGKYYSYVVTIKPQPFGIDFEELGAE